MYEFEKSACYFPEEVLKYFSLNTGGPLRLFLTGVGTLAPHERRITGGKNNGSSKGFR